MTDPRGAERRIEGAIIRGGAQRETTTTDQRLLESRGASDWVHTDPWRVLRIQSGFVDGFGTLAELGRRSVFSVLPGSTAMIRSTRWPRSSPRNWWAPGS